MDTTLTRYEEITASLPKGYRAREFRDSDREPMVAERNEQVHELQRGTADEWREWEKLDPPKDMLRVVVETSDGAPAASGDIGPGFMPRPDGALVGGVGVMRAHRGKGIGGALLAVVEAEAKRRNAPRIMAGTSVAFPGALEWATKRGYREIGRRIESYVDVRTFDPAPFADLVERVRGSGIRLVTLDEHFRGKDDAGRDAFWHELWEAETPRGDDVTCSGP